MFTADALHPALDPRAAALKRQILEAARKSPAPRRKSRKAQGALLIGLALAAMFALYFQWGGPLNAASRSGPITAWVLLGTALLASVATWLSLPARRSMLPRPPHLLLAVALGVPVMVGAWLGLWSLVTVDPFVRFGWRCLGLTAATAPWPFAVLVWASRRLDPVSPQLSGAAMGAAAGAWAAVMVELWCPLTSASHVLVGHVSPLLLLVGAGAALGEWTLRLRRVGTPRASRLGA
jgi:hypothetical protein